MKPAFIFMLVLALHSFGFAEPDKAEPLPENTSSSSAESEIAQEDFGFAASEDDKGSFGIVLGGKLSSSALVLFSDFTQPKNIRLGSLFEASLNLVATAPLTEVKLEVLLNDRTLPINIGPKIKMFPISPQIPRFISQAFVAGFFGPVTLSGGIQKVNWGKLDSLTVLDVINPIDLSDVTKKVKISRPMIYATLFLPHDIKLEAAFVPIFEGHSFALDGTWKLFQLDTMLNGLPATVMDNTPDTANIAYAQYALKLSTNVSSNDFGFQYYYGYLPLPAASLSKNSLIYNAYHHLGFEYSTAIDKITLKTELAANITNDIQGSVPDIYNPFLAWGIGLNYSLPLGFSIDMEANETIRLKNNNIRVGTGDIEYGRKTTNTELMLALSQNLLRGALTWNLAGLVAIENKVAQIKPSLKLLYGTTEIALDIVLFISQKPFKNDNHYIKIGLGYTF